MQVESFVVCIVGKMAQDVGMLWVSFPSCVPGFEGSIPTCFVFLFVFVVVVLYLSR